MSALQVVVMGVSGTGKSTVARSLADRLGWAFVEGDDLHPADNITAMRSGHPLSDADRGPWLDTLNALAREHDRDAVDTVMTCSALKRAYRDRLREGVSAMFFVHLRADGAVLATRMGQRERHFMPASLLDSQLVTLEQLAPEEHGVVVDVSGTREQTLRLVLAAVGAKIGS